jgi:hypothetical protein
MLAVALCHELVDIRLDPLDNAIEFISEHDSVKLVLYRLIGSLD